MKIRHGFVSNSSTSSFVVCGFKIEDNIENKKLVGEKLLGMTRELVIKTIKKSKYPEDVNDPKAIDEWYDDLFHDASQQGDNDIFVLYGEGVEALIVGQLLAYGDEVDSSETDIEKMRDIVVKARKEVGYEDVPIKIYTGTKCC